MGGPAELLRIYMGVPGCGGRDSDEWDLLVWPRRLGVHGHCAARPRLR